MGATWQDLDLPDAGHADPEAEKKPLRGLHPGEVRVTLSTLLQRLAKADRRNIELREMHLLLMSKLSSLESELAKANRLALYDALTGLPNRRLLIDRFRQAAPFADRHRQRLAVLFFDLDDFKGVNDQYGHEGGDRLLSEVASRLKSSIRQSDTACRYGGDEFVVLLTQMNSEADETLARKNIRDCLDAPYVIDGHTIRLAVSHGRSAYPEDSKSLAKLLRLADQSMFRNKRRAYSPIAG